VTRTRSRRPRARGLLALAALAALSLPAAPAAAATEVTLTATGGPAHTSFTAPNQVTLTPRGGTATATLTPGVASRVVLGSTGFAVGTHPNADGFCASGFRDDFDLTWELTVSGVTRILTVPHTIRWVCNNQGQLDFGTGAAARVTVPMDASTELVVSIAESDATRDGLQSGHFPPGYNGATTVRADLLLRSLDPTVPRIAYALTPAEPDGENGWYRSDVELEWTVTEEESPFTLVTSGCADRSVFADQAARTYSCSASSLGGSAGPELVTIKRDATPPTITGSLAPAAPDGADGWYVSAPTVSWACADATSGVAACSADTTAPEGVTTAFSGTARDHAGNAATATVGPAKVDLTDPAVACGTRPAFALGQAGAAVSATVTDAGSGPAQANVTAPAATGTVGVQTAAVTGTDRAGRTTTVRCSYSVGFGFSGFFAPVENDVVNLAKAGQAIPLKWRVVDGAGAGVTTLTRVSVTVTDRACAAGATADAVEEYATGSSGLQNLGDGRYQLNWATPKSYAGSCKTLRLDLGDGVARTADFSFTR
jgi:hypothetical protein